MPLFPADINGINYLKAFENMLFNQDKENVLFNPNINNQDVQKNKEEDYDN